MHRMTATPAAAAAAAAGKHHDGNTSSRKCAVCHLDGTGSVSDYYSEYKTDGRTDAAASNKSPHADIRTNTAKQRDRQRHGHADIDGQLGVRRYWQA